MSILTNEELCVLIKNGDDGLLPTLWEQVRKLIAMKAGQYFEKFKNPHGSEEEDLIQAGYFAVVKAIKSYKPEAGCKFTTFLRYPLLDAFNEVMGIRSSKRDWLNYAISLDEPITENGEITLLDTLGDLTPRNGDIGEIVIESVWNRELRTALNDAMTILTAKRRELLELHYFYKLSPRQIANMRGCSHQFIRIQENEAFDRICKSKHGKILAEFLYADNMHHWSFRSRIEQQIDDSLLEKELMTGEFLIHVG